MGLLKILSGRTEAAETMLEAAIDGADKMVLTKEEQLDYTKDTAKNYLELIRLAATESTPQSISRRLICLPIVYVWILMLLADSVLGLLGISETRTANLSNAIDNLKLPALGAIGFYVGRHIVVSAKKKF